MCIRDRSLKGVRGGLRDSGINIHSVRLPGLLAHQLVIMGSPGETYTIKHDTIDSKAYMPGLLQAIKKIGNFESAIESNSPVGPDPTILKLNLSFIR